MLVYLCVGVLVCVVVLACLLAGGGGSAVAVCGGETATSATYRGGC